MTIEPAIQEDLNLLKRALQQEVFRFVLIGHNRRSIYLDVSAWIREQFADQEIVELSFSNKSYREISDEMKAIESGIILIPDFDWLFRPDNEDICVAFNQRRDFYARRPIAILCFLQPSNFLKVPKKIPDWWSIRSLDFDFYRELLADENSEFIFQKRSTSAIDSLTVEQKNKELKSLYQQLELAEEGNAPLRMNLNNQIASLLYGRGDYDSAITHFELGLQLARHLEDRKFEGIALNNISQIFNVRSDYATALSYLEKSLAIAQEIGDKSGEGVTLNNISQIYDARGDYSTALSYLEQSLAIAQEIGDKNGEIFTFHNMAIIELKKEDSEKYLELELTAWHLALEINEAVGIYHIGSYFGQVLLGWNLKEEALPYLQAAHEIAQRNQLPDAEELAQLIASIEEG